MDSRNYFRGKRKYLRIQGLRRFARCANICLSKGGHTMTNTNMPWAVYRCDLIGPGNRTPKNEILISRHVTAREAMNAANKAKRTDREHSYTVGAA
jgi:hypothetical protein